MQDRVVISKFFNGWVWDRYDGDNQRIAICYGVMHETQEAAVAAAQRINAQPYVLEIVDAEFSDTQPQPADPPLPAPPYLPQEPVGNEFSAP